MKRYLLFLLIILLIIYNIHCQSEAEPELFFREDWKEIQPEIPVTQEHVNNDSLLLHLHGYATIGMKKSHHENIENDPYYVYSGQCDGKWALMFEHKTAYADLSAPNAKIVWRTKQSGKRYLRILLKLENGDWILSQQSDGPNEDWNIFEFGIDTIQWLSFDDETLYEMDPIETPDLSRVDQIGFTDLERGNGSPECSRIDWIEVWAKSVDRSIATGYQNILRQPDNTGQSIFFISDNLEIFITKQGPADLFLYDVYGRLTRHFTFKNLTIGKHFIEINELKQHNRVLFYLFHTKNINETGKIFLRNN